mmetsp:Transcript_105388/g.182883  ORF Transcript_105388/g.182883 Transcript_105388/m.182883 type:complete len:123 (+) Transcript_105388:2-370(+)
MPVFPSFSDMPWCLSTVIMFWGGILQHVVMACLLSGRWPTASKRKEYDVEELRRRCQEPSLPLKNVECPICCASLAVNGSVPKGSLAAPPCGHEFHWECLERWLQRCPTCPVCRYDVSEHPV